jgi:hypothetical protein
MRAPANVTVLLWQVSQAAVVAIWVVGLPRGGAVVAACAAGRNAGVVHAAPANVTVLLWQVSQAAVGGDMRGRLAARGGAVVAGGAAGGDAGGLKWRPRNWSCSCGRSRKPPWWRRGWSACPARGAVVAGGAAGGDAGVIEGGTCEAGGALVQVSQAAVVATWWQVTRAVVPLWQVARGGDDGVIKGGAAKWSSL